MYQPWCGGNPNDPNICTGLMNVTGWWAEPGNADKGSDGSKAYFGLISLDWQTSTRLWSGSTYDGATPGNPLTSPAQQVMLDDCAHVKANGWARRCFVYDNMVNSLGAWGVAAACAAAPFESSRRLRRDVRPAVTRFLTVSTLFRALQGGTRLTASVCWTTRRATCST
jgi:hypothetical protein